MSNYPPGVTGNEWQIAGYPEVNLQDVECDGEVTVADEDVECGWTGDIDDAVADGFDAFWTCPKCGKENNVSLDDGPDPDEAYDSRYDY